MSGVSFGALIEYTDWQRSQWLAFFREHGETALRIPAGLNGDGRFQTAGDLVRHIFSAEKRYVERLSGRPLTDTSTLASSDIEMLFQFGQQSRSELKDYIETLPDEHWNAPLEFRMMSLVVVATPGKVITHVLLHEIRHWAQIGTLMRLNGRAPQLQDLILCPAMGGEVRREKASASS